MGSDGDQRAVLDAQCRVRGIEGLWVIDGAALRGPPLTSLAGRWSVQRELVLTAILL